MKIGTFPENFSFLSQVVWGEMDSNIECFFFYKTRVCGGTPSKMGYQMTFHGFTGESHDANC